MIAVFMAKMREVIQPMPSFSWWNLDSFKVRVNYGFVFCFYCYSLFGNKVSLYSSGCARTWSSPVSVPGREACGCNDQLKIRKWKWGGTRRGNSPMLEQGLQSSFHLFSYYTVAFMGKHSAHKIYLPSYTLTFLEERDLVISSCYSISGHGVPTSCLSRGLGIWGICQSFFHC